MEITDLKQMTKEEVFNFIRQRLSFSKDCLLYTSIRLIDKAPRKGAEGLNIAFLHPKSTLGVLTELCEH